MILVPRAVRVYFATQPVSLRKSFDGLVNEIRHALGHDPLGGHGTHGTPIGSDRQRSGGDEVE